MNKTTLRVLALTALSACLLPGCAYFSVTQIDESPNERTITTKITGTAWFTSAQSLSKLKALQTDRSQSTGFDSLGQQGATNTAEVLRSVVRIMELARPTP